MSGCLDKLRCSCDCLDPLRECLRPKRNMLASIVSGTLFAVGWWVVIDACVNYAAPVYAAYHICGIVSTIALLMINAVSTGQVTGDAYNEGCVGQRGARAWLFVGFMFAFGGLIGSLWIFIQEFLVPAVTETNLTPALNSSVLLLPDNSTTTPPPSPTQLLPLCFPCWWQGVAFFLQNVLIFISAIVFKFGRTEEEVW